MAVLVPHRAIDAISTASDPKKVIWDLVGDLSEIQVGGDQVLVGVYVRPEKTRGGIIRPDMNKEEDIWQGKVGLVLKWGQEAFQDTNDYHFNGWKAEVNEWCIFKVGDTWIVKIRDCLCRMVRDVDIKMIVKDPTVVL